MEILEGVHRKAMKMIGELEHPYYEQGLFSLLKRKLQGDLIVVFHYLKGSYKQEGDWYFTQADNDRARENDFKLKEGRFTLGIMKKFFIQRVVGHWNRLAKDTVDALSMEGFEARLNRAVVSWI